MSALGDIWENICFEWGFYWRQRADQKQRHQTAQVYQLPPSTPPEATPYKFRLSRECSDCLARNEIFIDKYMAHIESMRGALHSQCANCGSDRVGSSSIGINDIDAEVLAFWMADEDSYFLSQDEDLILAEVPDAALIEGIAICDATSNWKVQALIEGLMVSFSDNEFSEDNDKAAEKWLRDNVHRWDQGPAWDYIRKRVREKLNL